MTWDSSKSGRLRGNRQSNRLPEGIKPLVLKHGRPKTDVVRSWVISVIETGTRGRDLYDLLLWDSRKTNNKGAKYTRKHRKILQETFLYFYIEELGRPMAACKQFGLSYSSIQNWLRGDTDFSERVQYAGVILKEMLEEIAWKSALAGDKSTVRWLLEKKYPDEYGEKVEHEHKGKIGYKFEFILQKIEQLRIEGKLPDDSDTIDIDLSDIKQTVALPSP